MKNIRFARAKRDWGVIVGVNITLKGRSFQTRLAANKSVFCGDTGILEPIPIGGEDIALLELITITGERIPFFEMDGLWHEFRVEEDDEPDPGYRPRFNFLRQFGILL